MTSQTRAVRNHPAPNLGSGLLGWRGQCGQATVEFVVLALVFVPLFVAVPLLGKYIDLLQTAEQASRYVAFEGAVRNSSSHWKPDSELAAEVRRRFFSDAGAPVKTGDVAGDFVADRNPVWTNASGESFIESFQDGVGVRTQIESRSPLGPSYASQLGLPRANFYRATVTVKPLSIEPFGGIDLSATRSTVLLVDAWTARSVADIRARIEGASGIYPIAQAAVLVDAIGQIPPLIFDPALKVGAFDWDIVPCDRLKGGC